MIVALYDTVTKQKTKLLICVLPFINNIAVRFLAGEQNLLHGLPLDRNKHCLPLYISTWESSILLLSKDALNRKINTCLSKASWNTTHYIINNCCISHQYCMILFWFAIICLLTIMFVCTEFHIWLFLSIKKSSTVTAQVSITQLKLRVLRLNKTNFKFVISMC